MSKSNKLTKPELREFLEHVTAHPEEIDFFLASGPSIKSNKRAVLEFLNIAKPSFSGKCTYILQAVDEALRDDIDIIKASCKEGFCIFRHISIRLKQETDLVRHILQHGDSREYLSIGRCDYNGGNEEFFEIACERDESNFWYASDEIKVANREHALDLYRRYKVDIDWLPDTFIFDALFFEAACEHALEFPLTYLKEVALENFSSFRLNFGWLAHNIDDTYREFIKKQNEIEDIADELYIEYLKSHIPKTDNPKFFEVAQLYYVDTLEKVGEQFNLSPRLIYEILRDDERSLKYLPDDYKNDYPIPENIVQTLPKEFQELIEKHKGALPQLLTYNPSLTQEDANVITADLRAMMMAGVKNFTDMIDFLDSRIGGTFRSTIEAQWRELLEEDENNPYDFIEREGPWEAYYNCDLSTLYPKILPEVVNSDIGSFDACDECKLFFHPHQMSYFYYIEKDMHVCNNCEGSAHVAKESGMDDYGIVSGIMGGGIPEDVVNGAEPQELMDRLKELVDSGYSKALARVFTMGGYHSDETDYLMENTQEYEDDLSSGKLTQDAYDFYQELLNESNDPDDLDSDEYEIYRMIRITDY
jgi:hypothetical protein